LENIENIEVKIESGCIGSIPIDAIVEARNALADEYITLKIEIEKPSIMTLIHRRRMAARVFKLTQYLSRLDAWLKGVK